MTDETTRDRIQALARAQLHNASVQGEVRAGDVWLDVTFYGLGDCLLIVPAAIARREDVELSKWLHDKLDDRIVYLEKKNG